MFNKTRAVRFSIVFLFVILSIAYVDWAELISKFSWVHLKALVAVQPIQIIALFLIAYRFCLLCYAEQVEYLPIFRGYALSLGFNSFLPARMSEIIKISYTNQHTSIELPTVTSAILTEKIFDVINLTIFLLLGFSSVPIPTQTKYLFLAVGFMVTCCFTVLVLIENKFKFFKRMVRDKNQWLVFLAKVFKAATLSLNFLSFSKLFFISFLSWLASFGVIWSIMTILLPDTSSLLEAFIVFSAMAIGRAIPGLPGSLGTYEAAIVFALMPMGYNTEEALAVAITMRLSQITIYTCASFFIVYQDGTGLYSLISEWRDKK